MDRIGLIAGNGDYPLLFAQAAAGKNVEVVAVAIEGETKKQLGSSVGKICWVHLGQISKLVKFFRDNNINKCVMAGGVRKVKLFKEIFHIDFEAIKLLMELRDKTDDSLLCGVCDFLKRHGIEVISATTFLEDLLAEEGVLTKAQPSSKQLEDIEFGKKIASTVASLGIGLTIVVKDKIVLAVEAIEGTDETIKRGFELGGEGCTVIKMARPSADIRFDLPVIGPSTVRLLIDNKIKCLAIESGKTLVLYKQDTLDLANKYGVSIVGVKPKV